MRTCAAHQNAWAYVFEGGSAEWTSSKQVVGKGQVLHSIAPARRDPSLAGQIAVLRVASGSDPIRFLLFSGKPIGEPVVQHGPFVMNSREEIEEAFRDYRQVARAVLLALRVY